MSRTFKLTIAYDGTDFVGWQIQPNGPTIQDQLQRALSIVTKQSVAVVGSGRTDAGVHALAQVASCRIETWAATADALKKALNTQLPKTIVVHDVCDAPDGFHAIRDAVSKRYRYQWQLGGPEDAFEHRYRWWLRKPIDLEAVADAAGRLLGEYDFASFQATGAPRLSTVRHIHACELINQIDPLGRSADATQRVAIEIEANGFLYNMVRNIVGTLVEVGLGKHPPSWIDEVVEAKDRDAAGPTAPAHGLFLQHVDYADCTSGPDTIQGAG